MTEARYFTADELAELLRVSVDTIFREARAGRLRSVVVGRQRRFPESGVDAWLQGERETDTLAPVIEMRRG